MIKFIVVCPMYGGRVNRFVKFGNNAQEVLEDVKKNIVSDWEAKPQSIQVCYDDDYLSTAASYFYEDDDKQRLINVYLLLDECRAELEDMDIDDLYDATSSVESCADDVKEYVEDTFNYDFGY